MFVAISTFTVANGMAAEIHEAFRRRPHRVDRVAGYVRMEVLVGADDPAEVWLLTYWKDEASFRGWHRSHDYRASHEGILKGLKLVPRTAVLRFFRHIAS